VCETSRPSNDPSGLGALGFPDGATCRPFGGGFVRRSAAACRPIAPGSSQLVCGPSFGLAPAAAAGAAAAVGAGAGAGARSAPVLGPASRAPVPAAPRPAAPRPMPVAPVSAPAVVVAPAGARR